MSRIPRQIIEKLIISNYRRLYQFKGKLPTVKKIKKVSVYIILLSFILSACKDDKANQSEAKEAVKTDENINKEEKNDNKKVILFYGNSLTAGYGLDPSESFPSNIANVIDSLKLGYKVVNAGLSGDTTFDGLKRLDWVMNQQVDIFVLELGANDMLRGLPLDKTRENLSQIIESVKAKNPAIKIVLCEMMAAPNMGSDYVNEFGKIYKDLSAPNDITFLPFFLNGVAGNPDLLLQDGKHPNADGQKIVATNVWKTLKDIL